jgi:hypothetical protein
MGLGWFKYIDLKCFTKKVKNKKRPNGRFSFRTFGLRKLSGYLS